MSSGAQNYRRYLSGDEQGLVEIIKEYKDGLILYLNSIVRNLSLAQELAEDTFVKIGMKKPSDRMISSFKTWLYTIGRNTALDYLRRSSRVSFVPIDEISSLSDEQESIELQYLKKERDLAVRNAMKHVQPEYAQALWLAYFEGFSCKEIAKIMGKTVHSVETLIYRARNALKKELIKEGYSNEDL